MSESVAIIHRLPTGREHGIQNPASWHINNNYMILKAFFGFLHRCGSA